jgi:hypothetical protein
MLVVASPVTRGDDVVEQAVERFALLLRYIDARHAQHLDGQRIEPLGVDTLNRVLQGRAHLCAHRIAGTQKRTRIG